MTRRRLLALLVVLALLGGAAWAWRSQRSKPADAAAFETAVVDRGAITAKVTATGTLSALVTVQVGSQVSGRIQALYADYNSRVKKGQRIARIDPELFTAAVEQARANLVAAVGNLAKAKAQAVDADRQLARNRTLAGEKLIAQADLDTSQANRDAAVASVQAAEGTVAQAKAALHQAEVNLAYTDIVSPTNGVVISRSVDVGQTVAASLSAPTLFVIAEDLAKMQVDTSVAEGDVGRLSDGMPASFTVDAFPGEVFRGKVRQIRNAATTTSNVVTYDAVIDVDNPQLKLRPGMTASVTFVYAEKEDVTRVPNAALRFRPPASLLAGDAGPGGQARAQRAASGTGSGGAPVGPRNASGVARTASDGRIVYRLQAGKLVPVRVRTGITDGSATELVEGELQPGDRLVTDAPASAGQGQGFRGPRGPL